MSKRCYIALYENITNLDCRLIVPIKSTKIRSAYGGMPQFFGGGALNNETNFETIKRELFEEGLGYIRLKEKAQIELVHKNTLERNNTEIKFFFYKTNDFSYSFNSFPFIPPRNGEMSSILEFRPFINKKNTTYNMCRALNITPSDHFQKSETYAAFNLILKKLAKNV